jgi:hypothetical protein
MLDYLAEVTMSILQKQKERDPNMGYARDFLGAIESVLPAITGRGVRVVANAGGVNPVACARAVLGVAERHGVEGELRVGVVTGDDLLPRARRADRGGHELRNMDTGAPLSDVRDRGALGNAYIGSTPIVEALARGANVVVTGRSTDTALTMAPLRHEFGWGARTGTGWPRGSSPGTSSSAARSAPGGNCLHDWRTIPTSPTSATRSPRRGRTARFVVTKHPGTGGRVSFHTPWPSSSCTRWAIRPRTSPPDVVGRLHEHPARGDRPRARARARDHREAGHRQAQGVDRLRSGWKAVGTLVNAWPDALEKAQLGPTACCASVRPASPSASTRSSSPSTSA